MYPTKQQILARPVRHRAATVATVRQWKRDFSGKRRTRRARRALLHRLAQQYGRPLTVEFARTFGDHYDPARQTIVLDPDRGSLVTTLHEFAHHLFGRSELTACRWSIWLFRQAFQRSYDRCTFRGHLLVKRSA